jgi:predicted metalloprotease with PDZ domain
MSFHAEDISAVFLFSGLHSDYHKPSDDWSKLDFARMGTLAEATVVLLAELCSASITDLAYIKPPPVAHGGGNASRRSGGGVWFGSIPDYGASASGMKLGGTMPGGPAEAAGLIKADVITAINDFQIVDIYDFMDSLGEFKDGQTVVVHFIRDEKAMTAELTFFPRPSGD